MKFTKNNKNLLIRAFVGWAAMIAIGVLLGGFTGTLLMSWGFGYLLSVFVLPPVISGAFGWFSTIWALEYIQELWERDEK